MAQDRPTEPMTVRTSKEVIRDLDALAVAMDRTRNYVVNQALQLYLETNAWQIEKIREGLKDAAEGRVLPAEAVYSRIATKRGWTR